MPQTPPPPAPGSLGAKAAALQSQTPVAERPVREAPIDRGVRLATLVRSDSEQVRIAWDEYNGHNYLSIRLWTCDVHGQWWPDKKGITIKPRELADFAVGVEAALEQAARG